MVGTFVQAQFHFFQHVEVDAGELRSHFFHAVEHVRLLGSTAAVVATALGACAFEKHLIAARSDGGPDAAFSAEPDELLAFVGDVRLAADALGGVRFGPSPAEQASLAFRRSLYVVADVAEGEELTADHVRAIRPAGGLAPKHLPEVLGRRARRRLRRGTPVSFDDLA